MKEHNKSQTVTANILLAHGSKDPRWRTSFENLLKRLENIRQIKYSAYAIWNYVDPV